jgi:hypothetical protein
MRRGWYLPINQSKDFRARLAHYFVPESDGGYSAQDYASKCGRWFIRYVTRDNWKRPPGQRAFAIQLCTKCLHEHYGKMKK